jgi:predicted PurR-regulated permease PerM
MAERKEKTSDAEFIRHVLIAISLAALAAAVYFLSDVLLLAFGAILVAVVLRTLARPIQAGLAVGERIALLASGIAVAAVLIGTSYLFGTRIGDQLYSLSASLPQAAESFSKAFPNASITDFLSSGLLTSAVSWGATIFGAVAVLVVVIMAGVYIAIRPNLYRDGLVMLFPKQHHPQVADTLAAVGEALRLWLGAQALAMVIVGVLIALSLSAVGVPSPLALGLIAGVAEFVPVAGPVIGATPALLLASTQGWHPAAWTFAVFIVVQQLESNVVIPLIAGRVVSLPPAVGLFAVIAMGVLFGPLGLLLGYPLAVVTDVVVRKLYVREVLREKVQVMGERRLERPK